MRTLSLSPPAQPSQNRLAGTQKEEGATQPLSWAAGAGIIKFGLKYLALSNASLSQARPQQPPRVLGSGGHRQSQGCSAENEAPAPGRSRQGPASTDSEWALPRTGGDPRQRSRGRFPRTGPGGPAGQALGPGSGNAQAGSHVLQPRGSWRPLSHQCVALQRSAFLQWAG